MFAKRFYSLLWLLLNLLVTAYEIITILRLRLQAATLWSYDLLKSRAANTRRERSLLERCKAQLSKVPRHFNIVIGPDDVQVDEETLARIISYALIMDIDYISFYDTRLPGRGHVSLEKIRVPKGVNCKELQENCLQWSTAKATTNGKTQTNGGVANGSAANGQLNHKSLDRFIEIHEIAPCDGRPLIAEVCRQLFEQRHTSSVQALVKDRTKLTQHISDELSQRRCKFPEPELSVIFNRDMCTFGMLPWQTRFTEFHTHATGSCFNAEAFANVLFKFSRCEQRWGK